ncbi:hypothetical protein C8R44DRAFT_849808 [Mycena epipterygia]|nr:hypothetical protein C8R44DRAFT_849808 [Mycena epipterygia]
MAQPLFDDHPLEQYLRAAGEPPEIMPGSSIEFMEDPDDYETELEEEPEWRPVLLVRMVEILQSVFASPPQSSPFAERFKYDVISSSLLASALPVPHSHRRSVSPSLPGKLKLDAPPDPPHELLDYWLLSSLLVIAAAFLSAGLYLFAILSLGGIIIYVYNHSDNSRPDMTSTMGALSELISANALWDSVVQDTIALLEKEEESPPSPVSALRLSLHSSLHTTQTQCDTVRNIFSALTAPLELAQLSEMYAPPSPRHSLPPASPPVSYESKRTTWSGSYTSLAGSPSTQFLKNREKRRSDLSSLLNVSAVRSHSAPSTPPLPPSTRILEVQEEDAEQFGAAALDLHRRRRISGIESLRLHPTPPRTPLSGSSTISHASRFTTMQTMRHPLAVSSLYHALEGALASKRYACSHLLALRFGDEDDEGYWEDVRSVMALLTTTFADAAARLTEALEESEHQEDEFNQSQSRPPDLTIEDSSPGMASTRATAGSMLTSFAPVPTHLTRFAAHVDAISSALDDAREHLAECVAALRNKAPTPEPHLRRRRSRTFSLSREAPPAEPPALQAYERLRRELGLALRECERGRDRLLDIVAPPPPPPPADPAESEEDSVPSLGHDASDECDEFDKASPMDDLDAAGQHNDAVVVAPGDGLDVAAVDDATAHLLLGASARHLPLPGAEQVFESEAEVGIFTRERSKLTREERIQLAKARRESGGAGLGISFPSASGETVEREKWGPGGEVVQELKDVIWKVGERRRKMTDGQLHSVDPNLSSSRRYISVRCSEQLSHNDEPLVEPYLQDGFDELLVFINNVANEPVFRTVGPLCFKLFGLICALHTIFIITFVVHLANKFYFWLFQRLQYYDKMDEVKRLRNEHT